MKTKNNQSVKKFTYICLSLSSIMLSSKIEAAKNDSLRDQIDQPVKNGYIPVPQLGKNIMEEIEGQNIVGPSSKIFKHSKNEIEDDLKKSPQEVKILKKKAKEAAKSAAKEAAKNAAYSFLHDGEAAKRITLSIMKHFKLKEENTREARLLHLAQNYAMNAARIAAEQAAYDVLKDEKEAVAVVRSLKLNTYEKKENQSGGKSLRPSPIAPKFKTLQDLKKTEDRLIKIQIVPSRLDQAKTAIELGDNTLEKGLSIADFIMKLIK